jgi:hypothetical protein
VKSVGRLLSCANVKLQTFGSTKKSAMTFEIQDDLSWLKKILATQNTPGDTPQRVIDEIQMGGDAVGWTILQKPHTFQFSVAAPGGGPAAPALLEIPPGEDWYIPYAQILHSSTGTFNLALQVINSTGPLGLPFSPATNEPINLIRFNSANGLTANNPAVLERAIHVRGGNFLRTATHNANLNSGALTCTGVCYRLPPGTYIPGTPFS